MTELCSPFVMGRWSVPNRIVLPPMVCAVMPSLHAAADGGGHVTPSLLAHYTARARGGAGLVIVEAAAVHPSGQCWPGGLTIFDSACLPGLTALAAALHDAGALAGIQLVHGGPQGSAALSGSLLGPSAVDARPGTPRPHAMSEEELGNVPMWFAKAAERAVSAGFDLVELHGAHGFLLDSFLMTTRNRRTDSYGGSPANRLRLLLETTQAVRKRIGDTLLGVRVSPFTKLEEGYPADDYRLLVTALAGAGVDVLHLSTQSAFEPTFGAPRSLGQWTRDFTPLPRIVAGGLTTAADAERLLVDGHAEFAAVGRAQLDNPTWATEACAALG